MSAAGDGVRRDDRQILELPAQHRRVLFESHGRRADVAADFQEPPGLLAAAIGDREAIAHHTFEVALEAELLHQLLDQRQ